MLSSLSLLPVSPARKTHSVGIHLSGRWTHVFPQCQLCATLCHSLQVSGRPAGNDQRSRVSRQSVIFS